MRPYVIGHSMGGYVGQRFLRDYPGRLAGLVNINSVPYADDPAKQSDRQREIDFILNGKLVQLAQIAVPNMYCKDNLRRLDENNVDILASPQVPVMFIYGDSDVYCPIAKIDRIKADLPGCNHFVVPRTGHNTFIEEPASTAALILDFIQ